jgi:hypothetical protein
MLGTFFTSSKSPGSEMAADDVEMARSSTPGRGSAYAPAFAHVRI